MTGMLQSVRIPTSLQDCDEMAKAATASEMIFRLAEVGAERGMLAEEWQDYNRFIETAVHLFVAVIPEYLRPANLCCDMLLAAERYRRTTVERRTDPAESPEPSDFV